MEKLKNKILELKESNKLFNFILNVKNITIILLSILLSCYIVAYSNFDAHKIQQLTEDVQNYRNQIDILNLKLEENNTTIDYYLNKIEELQTNNNLLKEETQKSQKENNKLKSEKESLEADYHKSESEKEQLKQEIEKLKTSKSNSSNSSIVTNSQNSSNSKASQQQNSTSPSNSYTVYITNTGKKYHSTGCRYLSKSKISIDKNEAILRGYTPCGVCNP